MKINQPRDYMQEALKLAANAAVNGEVPVGALVVEAHTGKIIAKTSNEMKARRDPTGHAEMIAIQKACEFLGHERFWDKMDLYVTLEPCPMCAQALSFVRLRRLYFGAYDPKGGGVEHGPRIFESTSCHYRPEVYGGIEETACVQILKDFFERLRAI
ncbi:MAG: nucleoside deaminase [Proteobacteria bacterium]|nr:nucleoside deaminase [Pseudomonadota bacterium]